jgi:hypothetical protein
MPINNLPLPYFKTYEWVLQARVFVPRVPYQPSAMDYSSLSGPFVSYKENELL